MHTHTVFFWLWKSATAEDRVTFRKGLEHLLSDQNVRHYVIGQPAQTDRDVVDNTYDFGITATFDSLTDHNAYQEGKHHQDFLDMCMNLWSRVQVYDIEN